MWKRVIWKNPLISESLIVFEEDVFEEIYQYRQTAPVTPESGGILIGYRRDIHLHIVSCTAPTGEDVSSRYSFRRQDRHHQKFAAKAWVSSEETLDYLGEWHTHPEIQPAPSSIDLREWKKISSRQRNPMVFLILGTDQNIWVGIGLRSTISRVTIA